MDFVALSDFVHQRALVRFSTLFHIVIASGFRLVQFGVRLVRFVVLFSLVFRLGLGFGSIRKQLLSIIIITRVKAPEGPRSYLPIYTQRQ